ncbi:MAG: hypothetical protein ACE5KM_06055 [Planctomycetaceae bacterium]
MPSQPPDNAYRDAEFSERLADLQNGRRSLLWRNAAGIWDCDSPSPAGVLSGSFNPLHEGHEQLRRVAERILNGPVHFELPIVNADKPPLRPADVQRRLAQFTAAGVLITRAATFVEKSRLFAGAAFVVGVDTAERIVHPRFYDDSEARMREALEAIREVGCRFLVAGREMAGRFQALRDVATPPAFHDLFAAIPPGEFRADVSSSTLRAP